MPVYPGIQNYLGIIDPYREKIKNILSQPWISVGPKSPEEQNKLNYMAEMTANALVSEGSPLDLILPLTFGPKLFKNIPMTPKKGTGEIPTKETPRPEGGKIIGSKSPRDVVDVFDGGVDYAKSLSDSEILAIEGGIKNYSFRAAPRKHTIQDEIIFEYLGERLKKIYGVDNLFEIDWKKGVTGTEGIDFGTQGSVRQEIIKKKYETDEVKIINDLLDRLTNYIIGPTHKTGKDISGIAWDEKIITAKHERSGIEITIPREKKSELYKLRKEDFKNHTHKYDELKSELIKSLQNSIERPKELPPPPLGGGISSPLSPQESYLEEFTKSLRPYK